VLPSAERNASGSGSDPAAERIEGDQIGGRPLVDAFIMERITSAAEMTAASKQARRAGGRVGFVPTLGALHAVHISLVRAARAQADLVVASIFVNPKQFGPNEDFAKYPRSLESDEAMLAAEKTDFLFHPSVDEMYPAGATAWVEVEGISDKLDGRSRPGHFRGVTTVVAKLFNSVQPDL